MVKYVLITGGDRGIGRATALKFASEGFRVLFTYRACGECAEETARMIKELGEEPLYTSMDVGDEGSVKDAWKFFKERVDRLDVLVNNAGIISFSGFEGLSLDEWVKVIRVNLTGPYLVTKAFLPLLKRSEAPAIVNVASVAGMSGNVVASTAYCASKAGLIGFTKRLAVELGPQGIRVNAVAPSFVETDMVKEFIDTPEKLERVKSLHPLRDIAKPEDVANVIYFLATESSRFITGQVISVNGGRFTF